jgi:hypothetical protein
VARVLQAHLDGELADPMSRLVAHHLDLCLRCGLQADSWRWLKRSIAGLAPRDDPRQLSRVREFVDDLVKGS